MKENSKHYTEMNSPLKILLLKNKGGKTCAKIIEKIIDRPYNINQLANELNIYYNTVYYHVQIFMIILILIFGFLLSMLFYVDKTVNNVLFLLCELL